MNCECPRPKRDGESQFRLLRCLSPSNTVTAPPQRLLCTPPPPPHATVHACRLTGHLQRRTEPGSKGHGTRLRPRAPEEGPGSPALAAALGSQAAPGACAQGPPRHRAFRPEGTLAALTPAVWAAPEPLTLGFTSASSSSSPSSSPSSSCNERSEQDLSSYGPAGHALK